MIFCGFWEDFRTGRFLLHLGGIIGRSTWDNRDPTWDNRDNMISKFSNISKFRKITICLSKLGLNSGFLGSSVVKKRVLCHI